MLRSNRRNHRLCFGLVSRLGLCGADWLGTSVSVCTNLFGCGPCGMRERRAGCGSSSRKIRWHKKRARAGISGGFCARSGVTIGTTRVISPSEHTGWRKTTRHAINIPQMGYSGPESAAISRVGESVPKPLSGGTLPKLLLPVSGARTRPGLQRKRGTSLILPTVCTIWAKPYPRNSLGIQPTNRRQSSVTLSGRRRGPQSWSGLGQSRSTTPLAGQPKSQAQTKPQAQLASAATVSGACAPTVASEAGGFCLSYIVQSCGIIRDVPFLTRR